MLLPRFLLSSIVVAVSAAANEGPIVDLGHAGTYRGVLQNNGTWVYAYEQSSIVAC